MYNPQTNLLEAIRLGKPLEMFPWDHYFPEMADADFLLGDAGQIAVKSFFVRTPPFGNSYIVAAGITAMLRQVADMDFADPDFQKGMRANGFSEGFLKYLEQKRKLRLQIWAPHEGDIFFPNEPVISVRGPLVDSRLIEGIITVACNFPMLVATKWHRLKRAVGNDGWLMDFSRRRAQNPFDATLYAMLVGCDYTSNDEMQRFFEFLVIGTMGHEWIMRFGDVYEAFCAWLSVKPHKPFGLVDTMQCLTHDYPLWLKAVDKFKDKIKAANPPTWGWRNDSGDLADLTIEQYRMFKSHDLAKDPWFWDRMRIVLTNDLDEYSIDDIRAQILRNATDAGLDAHDILRRIIWAAGTKPGTCYDQASSGGVAKLMEAFNYQCIKLARDSSGQPGIKTSIPGFNLSARIWDRDGRLVRAVIYPMKSNKATDIELLEDGGQFSNAITCEPLNNLAVYLPDAPATKEVYEGYRAQATQRLVYDSLTGDGFTKLWENPTISDVVARLHNATEGVHWTSKRLNKPEPIKTVVTKEVYSLRQKMISQGVLRADKLK